MAYASLRRTTALALAAGTGLCIPSLSRASIINWINAAGGSAGTASNWNPAQVPTSLDDLVFNITGAYAVNFPNNVNATRTQTYMRGTVTSTFSGHQLSSTLLVAPSNPNVATLNLVGALYVTNSAVIGRDAGSNGTMSIAAGVSFITILGPGNVLIVGNSGTGVLNINGGSLARIDTDGDDIRIGNFATGIGTVNLSSSNGAAATMRINNPVPGADLIVGSQGNGTLNIGTRGQVLAGADAYVAMLAGSQGRMTFSDPTATAPGTMTVPRDLHVAHNAAASASGSAIVTVDGGGLLQVGTAPSNVGTLFVGDADGGNGTINLIRGEVQTQNLVIDPAHGSISHTGGTLRLVAGGSFNPPSTLNVSGTFAGNEPVVRFENSAGTLNGGFSIGSTGSGTLAAVQGTVLQAVPLISGGLPVGSMAIGLAAGSRGTLMVSGVGSRFETSDIPGSFAIGGSGSAIVTLADHGVIDTHASVVITSGTAATSSVNLSGASTFNSALRFFVGGVSTPQGIGQVSLQESSNLNCAQLTVQQGSSLSVDDSTVSVNGSATIRGMATIGSAGELAANTISIVGSLTGNGTVYGNVSIAAGATVHATGGSLFIGSSANAPASFSNLGTLQIDGQEVYVLSSTPAAAGTIILNGGSLHGTGGLVFGPTGSLTGGGSFFTPVQFDSHTFVQSTISPGFTFNAPVTGHLSTTSPTTFMFAAGGDFTGDGNVQAFLRTEEEASITATGDLSLGNDSVDDCVQLSGPLHVGTHFVALRSDTPSHLGVLTTIDGGTLQGPANNSHLVQIGPFQFTVIDPVPLVLDAASVIRGSGQVLTKIYALPGSVIDLTGDMRFVGSSDATIFSGLGNPYVAWDATMNVGSHAAVFSGLHQLDGITQVDGGTIEAGRLRILGTVTGRGVLRSAAGVENIGTISPGGAAIGEFLVQGQFQFGGLNLGVSTLEMDVDGDQGYVHDQINVQGGDVTLGGHLRVRILTAPPDPSVEYPLLTTDTGIITGTFDTADLPPGMTIVYRSQEVVLTGYCAADFNQDGGVDGNDVDAFFAAWESGDSSADVNHDGGVDGSDVDLFFSLWEAGGC